MSNTAFQLVESKTVPLTREFLDQFVGFTPSPVERERDDKRVKHLRSKYDAGLWTPCSWVTAKVRDMNDIEYRANGFHSSTMLSALDGLLADGLMVHWDRFQVQTLDDLALLFRQYDDRKSARSPADVAGAYQGLEEDLRATPRVPAKLAIESVNWWRAHVERSPTAKGDDRYTLFHERALHPFIAWVSADIFSGKVPELAKEPVVASMFVTFEANEIECRSFWHKVSQGGDEYQEGSPDRVLSDWLRGVYQRENAELAKVGPGQLYQGCIYAWNAHRRGEPSIKSIRHDARRGWLKAIA
jgi:hypothetical protein